MEFSRAELLQRPRIPFDHLEAINAALLDPSMRMMSDLLDVVARRDRGAFIGNADYRYKVLGERAEAIQFKDHWAVTLEMKGIRRSARSNGAARATRYFRLSERDGQKASGRRVRATWRKRLRDMPVGSISNALPSCRMMLPRASWKQSLD